jgi:hypothetical protein
VHRHRASSDLFLRRYFFGSTTSLCFGHFDRPETPTKNVAAVFVCHVAVLIGSVMWAKTHPQARPSVADTAKI